MATQDKITEFNFSFFKKLNEFSNFIINFPFISIKIKSIIFDGDATGQ
jgi:hypothetical protein